MLFRSHVRAHEVYEVGNSLPANLERLPPEGVSFTPAPGRLMTAGATGGASLMQAIRNHPKVSAGIGMAAVLAAAVGIRMTRTDTGVTPAPKPSIEVADARKADTKPIPKEEPRTESKMEAKPAPKAEPPAKKDEPATPPVAIEKIGRAHV